MRIIKNPPRHPESPMIAQVSYANTSGFGVVGASQIASPLTFAPRGIAYMPGVGDNILLMPIDGHDVCAGTMTSGAGLRPGELRLFSGGGASILLAANGDIVLNGVVITRNGIIVTP